MKLRFGLLTLLLAPLLLLANVAQPGIYQAGGTRTFTLLNPADSLSFQTVEMAREQVSVLLYPGFAVVKGQYWLRNTEDTLVSMTVGYPVNEFFESDGPGSSMAEIWFPELYGLQAFTNSARMEVVLDTSLRYADASGYERVDWYTWEMAFAPGEETLIEVYFLVNTNEAQIREGYDKDYDQVFLYVLESGAIWKGAIGAGEVRIQGRDGVQLSPETPGSSRQGFVWDSANQALIVSFAGLKPKSADNVIIRPGAPVEAFDFPAVLADAASYYEAVDTWSEHSLNLSTARPVNLPDPFAVESRGGGWLVGGLMLLVVVGPWLIGGLLLVALVVFVIKKIRKNSQV